MRRTIKLSISVLAIALSGCAVTPKSDLSAFVAAAPRSILVVPAVNKSLDVDAANYLLSTLTIPLAEKGFYVFPVNTAKVVLEQEGFYEGEQVHRQPPEVLAKLFGADAILYVTINRWDAQYAILTTTVTVDFGYRIVFKDGRELWQATQRMQYSPQSSSGGSPIAALIVAVVNAAVARAAPNYLPLTQQANRQVFVIGPTAIPDGPYRTAGLNGQPVAGYLAPSSPPAAAPPAAKADSRATAEKPATALVPASAPTSTAPTPPPQSVQPVQTIPSAPPVSSPAIAKSTQVIPPAAPLQALAGGKDSYQAERLAKDLTCHANPTVILVGKEAGSERYSVACRDGTSITIRCEFGNCVAVR